MNVDMKEEVDWLMKRAGRHSTVGMLLCMVGVCVLLGAFAMFLLRPGSREDVQPAKILFAGTEDDADCAILLSQDTFCHGCELYYIFHIYKFLIQ